MFVLANRKFERVTRGAAASALPGVELEEIDRPHTRTKLGTDVLTLQEVCLELLHNY